MSERAKVGAVVEMQSGPGADRPKLLLSGGLNYGWEKPSHALRIDLPSLDDAETIRDALSAFIAFHRRMPPPEAQNDPDFVKVFVE